MSKLRLVIKETNDRTPGMEGCVHIEFDNGESGMPYVDREFAVELVRRWNTHEDLVEALRDMLAQRGDYLAKAQHALAQLNP